NLRRKGHCSFGGRPRTFLEYHSLKILHLPAIPPSPHRRSAATRHQNMADEDLSWDFNSTGDGSVSLDGQDIVLSEHLHKLCDGVTRRSITEDTTLVPLYDFQAPDVDNVLLENLTGVCRYSIQCQLLLDGDHGMEPFPPTASLTKHGFHLRLTFNKLLFAPVIRFVCNFVILDKDDPTRAEVLPVALEWHFNDYNGPDSGIRDYRHSPDGVISFTAGPATVEGINIAEGNADLGQDAWEVIKLLRSFVSKEERHEVKIKLNMGSAKAPVIAEMEKIFARLPGGKSSQLPSIGQTEYAAWGSHPNQVHSQYGGMLRPAKLLSGNAKHPMVSLECGDTFSTVKEAGVQLAYAATAAHFEAVEAVKLWASVPHRAKLFSVGYFPVIGVNFRDFPRLGSIKDKITFRLPNQMTAEFRFQATEAPVERGLGALHVDYHGAQRDECRESQGCKFVDALSQTATNSSGSRHSELSPDFANVWAVLVDNVSGLPPHDAFFQITSEPPSFFSNEQTPYLDIEIKPEMISATFAAQLDTIAELQRGKNARWHGVLLNQIHDVLDSVDLTQARDAGAVIPPHERAHADRWLRGFVRWNAEQLAVIDGVKKAKGGVIIVMGPAGTGKTLLQQALAVYFYMLGFHILALAPANSNADHLATELKNMVDRDARKVNPHARIGTDFCFHRLWPGSRDQRRDGGSHDNDEGGNARPHLGSLQELLNGLQEYESQKGTVREHGVVHAVIGAAAAEELVLSVRLRNDNGVSVGDVLNPWDLLRDFLRQYKIPDIRLSLLAKSNVKVLDKYRFAYRACKGHIVGLNRFMITTTTTARSSDMTQNWYEPKSTYGVPRVGVIVFVDEAAKDLESQCWAGVVCDKWAASVSGLVMFGDDKQLRPTNTCSRGTVTFNAFNDRLNIDLPSRLVREGFPVYHLLEQRRMHRAISAFPNRHVYNNKLRDGPGTDAGLDEKLPGLKQVLINIQADHGIRDQSERKAYKYAANDAMARLHWVEVQHGERVRNPATQSICVHEHVDVFFAKIYPSLRDYFRRSGKKLSDNVMVICAYGFALHQYHDRIRHLLRNSEYQPSDMPRVITVDGSQGNEAPIVIFDGSLQRGDERNIGFMSDLGRVNVAITRAKDVLWIIGGSMSLPHSSRHTTTRSLPLLTKYKRMLDALGHVHRFM
ncbi:AAA domain, partial [Teratosphaeria destructans]